MRRVPLVGGSRVVLVPVGDDDVVLRPPPSPVHVADVPAAVRDALRFPLSGPPLEPVAPRGGRATIVVQPPALPFPGAQRDVRREALASAMRELERCGIRNERQTLLVAGGLGRRLGYRELERLLPPSEARVFRGRVAVHDAESEELVPVSESVRIHPSLVDTDLVLVVGAAETVLHGGPGALVAACDAATVRSVAGGSSLLEASGSLAWTLALGVERALARNVPVLGVSLVLDLPRLTGAFRGYPHDPEDVRRLARSWVRAAFSRLPAPIRREVLSSQGRRLDATAAYAGPPSVAHAEALLRGVELRGARLQEPVDALVVGAPWSGPHLPYTATNPVTAASVVLGLALRLHRDAFPVSIGGTLVLVHPLSRSFAHADAPYAAMLAAAREARDPEQLAEAERDAADDSRALAAYRAGSTCHPRLPYADWAGCAPALSRLGRVIVAGCRDAHAARALGFVPSRGVASALEMAHGVAGGKARVGILLAPPYAPLLVGGP
ncbi:MAG TPA: lactate racemase domain-containing protein [Gaiellaceae bacterium]|nr:lactate racemase domain-containing protein [Gaiellaceae bacterium]